ncbi:uncharacterized protein MYCFIDRAFT_195222 [Pseudocercospora fijiensis CIRAD86]|uniref:Uncharacterized protein n=1 Tax=Pseudocercospora fijiensis (strain CIRAD86) TaxID=383855 RepID=M3AHJ1_PSEFD|nr:uncharacterized protein MYCFIDRAFT_195222 [Pseudocercospora fijiensis CIRAD86]EME84061.1 hypothetical protein MYCFIDRAFT_195222 [Pseudocercospora fijiensis CIRAD86]
MDSSLRNLKDLNNKIGELQAALIKRYGNLIGLAAVRNKQTDRSVTAVTQYQIQTETAALIRAAEEVQSLIRQMQEMWLFGQLNTLDESKAQKQSDENAAVVADLLKLLHEKKKSAEGG